MFSTTTELRTNKLRVVICENRTALGNAAAIAVSDKIKELLATQSTINMIFAAAPSQNEFLEGLVADKSIPWAKINAFHMDEYIGLPENAPQGFGRFLKRKIFELLPFRSIHYINGNANEINEECARYAELLESNPPDIVCMGIGENTHLAFNDPHVARFNDHLAVKTVTLDLQCRQQQVNDGCFSKLSEVPEEAITLTIPTLMQGRNIFSMVPGSTKASAISLTLKEDISEKFPSTILRNHPSAILFVDRDSYSQVL
jgi:glucosamine-6-phosphate deaminase